MPIPSVGRAVHYVSFGTPGGEYPKACRAATVTEVDPADPDRVGLCVMNPTGLFFHSLGDGGCRYDPGDLALGSPVCAIAAGGTWHWPERTPE